jgi:eukaryotic-like serine/threonine-protein kinase
VTGEGAATRVGELVGAKYRIARLLAQGGMGVVYEAQHTVVRRRFAVKFLRRDLAERRDILTRFHHEAEAAGALESENVAAAVDFGIAEDGTPYIVMEYLVGESLDALLGREGRLPIARAGDLVAQAARGIQVAHAAGIIHRDLKPQNLFVCRRQDGTDLLKVLDFGVAKLQAADEMNAATRTGAMVGTVAYMSPEQARGDKIVDARSDVYALGAIAYELCAGRKPHPGESHNAILHHIATQPAVPLESVAPELPADFVEIVARTLAADPAARPASAGALVEALAPFAKREVWPAPKLDDSAAARLDSAPRSPIAEPRGSAGLAGQATPARRRLRPGQALMLVGAAVAAIATIRAVTGPGRQTPAAVPREAAAPVTNSSLASREQPPAAARAALTANVASASNATTPVHPLAGAGGSAAGTRRRAARPASDPTRSPTAPATAAGPRSPSPPVTFDQQNPYE